MSINKVPYLTVLYRQTPGPILYTRPLTRKGIKICSGADAEFFM